MWQIYYNRASELLDERRQEAERDRLAHLVPQPERASLAGRLRRSAALAAAGLADRLDECAAREAFERLAVDRSR